MIRILFISIIVLLVGCGDSKNENITKKDKNTAEIKASDSKEQDSPSIDDNGKYQEYYPDGSVKIDGQMKDGKKDGLWIAYYESGNKWSENYFVNGQKNGHSITWYKNGVIRYVGEYKNNKKTGEWKFYDREGNLVNKESY